MPARPGDRVARVHRQPVAGDDAAAGDLGAAHLDRVLVRLERDVVVDADRGDHDAELGGDLAADDADAARAARRPTSASTSGTRPKPIASSSGSIGERADGRVARLGAAARLGWLAAGGLRRAASRAAWRCDRPAEHEEARRRR